MSDEYRPCHNGSRRHIGHHRCPGEARNGDGPGRSGSPAMVLSEGATSHAPSVEHPALVEPGWVSRGSANRTPQRDPASGTTAGLDNAPFACPRTRFDQGSPETRLHGDRRLGDRGGPIRKRQRHPMDDTRRVEFQRRRLHRPTRRLDTYRHTAWLWADGGARTNHQRRKALRETARQLGPRPPVHRVVPTVNRSPADIGNRRGRSGRRLPLEET